MLPCHKAHILHVVHFLSSHLMADSLWAEVTMFLRQIYRWVDQLVVAFLLPLRHGAAGPAEQARDPLAGGVLHNLGRGGGLCVQVAQICVSDIRYLAILLLLVSGGAGHLGVVSTLLCPLPCATLLQGPVTLSHLDSRCERILSSQSKLESSPSPSDSGWQRQLYTSSCSCRHKPPAGEDWIWKQKHRYNVGWSSSKVRVHFPVNTGCCPGANSPITENKCVHKLQSETRIEKWELPRQNKVGRVYLIIPRDIGVMTTLLLPGQRLCLQFYFVAQKLDRSQNVLAPTCEDTKKPTCVDTQQSELWLEWPQVHLQLTECSICHLPPWCSCW